MFDTQKKRINEQCDSIRCAKKKTMAHSMSLNNRIHRFELPGNCPVFTVVMVICHYIEIIGEFLLPPIRLYNIYDHHKILFR